MIKKDKLNAILLSVITLLLCFTTIVIRSNHIYAADDPNAKKPMSNVVAGSHCKADGLKIPVCDSNYSCVPGSGEKCLENNPIIAWLGFIINVVASVVGVGAVAMLVFAGVQYTTAADNASQVEAAKKKIGTVVLGLVAFIFLYAFLNWLIPGGVLG